MGVAQPADVSLTTDFPVEPADVLARLAARPGASRRIRPSSRCARASAPRTLNVKVAQAAYTPTLTLSTGWGGNSYQYTDADYLVNQARGSALGQHGRRASRRTRSRTRVGLPSTDCSEPRTRSPTRRRDAIRARNHQFPFKFQRSPLALSASLSIPVFDNFNREERVQRPRSTARRRCTT